MNGDRLHCALVGLLRAGLWERPEWKEGLGEPNTNVQWHYGFWGQFINARGTFNAKAGAKVRETGSLVWYPRYSRCTTKAMREHINAL